MDLLDVEKGQKGEGAPELPNIKHISGIHLSDVNLPLEQPPATSYTYSGDSMELPPIKHLPDIQLPADGASEAGAEATPSSSEATPRNNSLATTVLFDNKKEESLPQTPTNGEKDEEAQQQQPPPPPPTGSDMPDGGLQAWLQIFGAFCLYMNSWGMIILCSHWRDYPYSMIS